MKEPINFKNITIKELASVIAAKFEEHEIDSVLVGGACVSIYSKNRYESYDLDYVTHEDMKKIVPALKELNFQKKGKYFVHPECPYFIDFVSPPVAIGDEPVEEFEEFPTSLGHIKMLSPTDSIKDRLASYYYWGDSESLQQAIDIYSEVSQKINLDELKRWSKKEKFSNKYKAFLKGIGQL